MGSRRGLALLAATVGGAAACGLLSGGCGRNGDSASGPPGVPSALPSSAVPATTPTAPLAIHRKINSAGLGRRLDRYLSHRVSGVSVVMVDRTSHLAYRYHPRHVYVTASVAKVDILMALLLQNQRTHRRMTAAELQDADIMIRYSDNKAADRLYTRVGGAAGVNAVNRTLGLHHTYAVDGRCIDLLCWGITRTTAGDQIRLLEKLITGRLNARDRAYVIGLMSHVTSEEAWGISAAALKGDRVALKNGWLARHLDHKRWVINSIGRVEGHGHDLLIAVLSEHNPTAGYGIETVEHVVRLVAEEFRTPPSSQA